MSSYYEKIAKEREELELKKKSVKKERVAEELSSAIIDFAEKTIVLKDYPAFKSYNEFESQIITEVLTSSFTPKTHNPKMSYGELMAYNEGFLNGVKLIRDKRNQAWFAYLKNSNSRKENNEDEKKAS